MYSDASLLVTAGRLLILFFFMVIGLTNLTKEQRAGPGCLNSFSAPISGASAGVRLPSGGAAV
jgi:hypothetical protein